MPTIKNILNHVLVEIAARRRRCHRTSGHAIVKGQVCLVVVDDRGSKRNYCPDCAKPILVEASRRLAEYSADLGHTGT